MASTSVVCAQAGKAEPAKGAAEDKKLSVELAELRKQVKRLQADNTKLKIERDEFAVAKTKEEEHRMRLELGLRKSIEASRITAVHFPKLFRDPDPAIRLWVLKQLGPLGIDVGSFAGFMVDMEADKDPLVAAEGRKFRILFESQGGFDAQKKRMK